MIQERLAMSKQVIPKEICEVIKRNELYVGKNRFLDTSNNGMQFLLYLIVFSWTKLPYLWNPKSDFDGVIRKTKLSDCFTKYTKKLKFDRIPT